MAKLRQDESPEFFRDGIVYREWGNRFLILGNYPYAENYFEKAIQQGQHNDLMTYLGLCRTQISYARYLRALATMEKCVQIAPHYSKVKQLQLRALFQVGEFELSLMYAHQGYRERKTTDLEHGIHQGMEIIQDCVGINTDPKALKNLEPWILDLIEYRDMLFEKLKEEVDELAGVEEQVRFQVNSPEVQAEARSAKLRRLMAEMYLGYLAHDLEFFRVMAHEPGKLDSPNNATTERLLKLTRRNHYRANRRQCNLRMRRPLYVTLFERKLIPKGHKNMIEMEKKLKRNLIIVEADFLLHKLHYFRKRKDYISFFSYIAASCIGGQTTRPLCPAFGSHGLFIATMLVSQITAHRPQVLIVQLANDPWHEQGRNKQSMTARHVTAPEEASAADEVSCGADETLGHYKISSSKSYLNLDDNIHRMVDRVKDKFDNHCQKMFPLKQRCLHAMYNMVAWTYIDPRDLRRYQNIRIKRTHLKRQLGIRDSELPRDADVGWIQALDRKETLRVFRRRLAMASDSLELAWLYHELCKHFIQIQRYDLARFYYKKTLDMSEEAESEKWTVNAHHLLIRIEICQNYRNEAKEAALLALSSAKKLGLDFLVEFYSDCIDIIDGMDIEKMLSFDAIAVRQQAIRDFMPEHMKTETDYLWRRMDAVPAKRRLSVMPGCKPMDKEFKLPCKRKSILPSPPKDYVKAATKALLAQYEPCKDRPGYVDFDELI